MPGLFEQFPHTNLHELNLDWMIDLLNTFKDELENRAVLSVNGMTGDVTLYESENVVLPPLTEASSWRLVRMMDGQYVGVLFQDGHIWLQQGNSTLRLLTSEDIPSSAGVVSINGMGGVVTLTGRDIPISDDPDADSIRLALETETNARVQEDNTLSNLITNKPNTGAEMPLSATDPTSVLSAINDINSEITPINLSENTDLNDITKTGVYYSTTPGISQSLLNRPWNLASEGIIEVHNTGDAVVQTVRDTYYKTVTQRYQVNGLWSQWGSVTNAIGSYSGNQTLDSLRNNIRMSGSEMNYMADSLITGWATVTAYISADGTQKSILVAGPSKIIYTHSTNGGTTWTTGSVALS